MKRGQGWKFEVHAAEQDSGSCPALDFLESLSPYERVKLDSLIRRFAETGEVNNKEQIARVEDNLYEFKPYGLRMLWYYSSVRHRIVLTNGFKKTGGKKGRIKKGDLDTARFLRNKYERKV